MIVSIFGEDSFYDINWPLSFPSRSPPLYSVTYHVRTTAILPNQETSSHLMSRFDVNRSSLTSVLFWSSQHGARRHSDTHFCFMQSRVNTFMCQLVVQLQQHFHCNSLITMMYENLFSLFFCMGVKPGLLDSIT